METIKIYCDGACKGNTGNGVGGWGVFSDDLAIELYGGNPSTTNNRMEIQAVIETFIYLMKHRLKDRKNPKANNEQYIIYTDSNYVVKGMNEWIHGWERKNYKDVKNDDLWRTMFKLKQHFKDVVFLEWVKGHSGIRGNEIADQLANKGCQDVIHGKI